MIGPPGVGKGTQATKIADEFDVTHYSTGDIFREVLRDSSGLAKKLERYINKGELVPDGIVFKVVKEVIFQNRTEDWVLDGYPRNVNQAEMLGKLLDERGQHLDHALYIFANENVLIKRLSRRRVCPDCGAIYNMEMNPPEVDEICDKCGASLIQREDDKPETVKNRLSVFMEEVRELYDFYDKKNILREVNGEGSAEEVFARIKEVLEGG